MYRYTERAARPSAPRPDVDRHGVGRPPPEVARPTEPTEPAEPPEVARPTETAETDSFVRDAPTVLAYAALACYTFWLYAFGPALALLREELQFS